LRRRSAVPRALLYRVVLVGEGKIVDSRAVGAPAEALPATPSPPPPPAPGTTSSVSGMATILPVRDLDPALDHYRRLGFRVAPYDGGYGYAVRGAADLHLAVRPGLDPRRNATAVYLYVAAAAALHARSTGPGRPG